MYIVVKGRIIGTNKKKLTFEKKVPFRSCISKINNSFVENTEVLRIVIPIYDCSNLATIIL